MGKGTKELLHKILSNQKLMMDKLKITVPTSSSEKVKLTPKKVLVKKTTIPKAPTKIAQRKNK